MKIIISKKTTEELKRFLEFSMPFKVKAKLILVNMSNISTTLCAIAV